MNGSSIKNLLNQGKNDLNAQLAVIEDKQKEAATESLAGELGLSYINLKGFPIGPETLALITEATARAHRVICFYRGEKELKVGAVEPESVAVTKVVQELADQLLLKTNVHLISEVSLKHVLTLYKNIPHVKETVIGVEIKAEELKKYERELTTFRDLAKKIKRIPATELVTAIIAGAIKSRASDIHVEAEENRIKVRYRIDGVLQDAALLDTGVWHKLVSRLKLLAKLKINVVNKPQDGRFTIFLSGGDKIDVRVSVLPTAFGESIVIRLLMSNVASLKFEELGITGRAFEQLKQEVERPNGMIITTGPTGSGKTTTLYAILNKLNLPETKIITIEDPIEYQLAGVNQSQVDAEKGLSFAAGLKSIVRQDPDIVMVGEIRDLETAETAIQAALTGHLVLSTIHTNSAAGTIPRFLSMGAKGFLLAPAINAMIGQRLVRRIHEACKEELTLEPDKLTRVKNMLDKLPIDSEARKTLDLNNLKFYHGKGCTACHDIGYLGRIGIYEIMAMTPEIEKMIMKSEVSEFDLQDIAVKNGMITMVQDGLLKALQGLTTVAEVFKVAE